MLLDKQIDLYQNYSILVAFFFFKCLISLSKDTFFLLGSCFPCLWNLANASTF